VSELKDIYEKMSMVRSRLEHDALPYQLMGLVREVHEGIASLLGVDTTVTQIETPAVEEIAIVEETPTAEEVPVVEEVPVIEEAPVVEETVDVPVEEKVADKPAKAKTRNAATAE